MARIAGVDIPRDKRVDVSLRYIFGIGPGIAGQICTHAAVSPETKVRELTDDEISRIREYMDGNFVVEGELRKRVRQNIQRLVEINSYRGIRHRRGLPVRGQRTRTNARTKRGARPTRPPPPHRCRQAARHRQEVGERDIWPNERPRRARESGRRRTYRLGWPSSSPASTTPPSRSRTLTVTCSPGPAPEPPASRAPGRARPTPPAWPPRRPRAGPQETAARRGG